MTVEETYPLSCVYKGFKILEIQHYDGTFSHYMGIGDGDKTKHYSPCHESLEETKKLIDRFWAITYSTASMYYRKKKEIIR